MTAETNEVAAPVQTEEVSNSLLGDNAEVGQVAGAENPNGIIDANEPSVEVSGEAGEAANWFYDKDVPGKGERPEWLDDKFIEQYGDVMNAAKGVKGLRSKLGGFTGAPEEDYTYEIPEEFNGSLDLDIENPLYKSFSSFAKEKNMSQETFKECLDLYTANQFMELQGVEETNVNTVQAEIQKLGDNFEERKQDIESWIRETMPEAEAVNIINNVETAKQFKLLEQMKRASSQSQIPAYSHNISTGPTKEEYDAVKANPKYQRGTPFGEDAYHRIVKPFLLKSIEDRKKG